MSLFQIIGIALVGVVISLIVKSINPSFSVYVSLITTVMLLYFAIDIFTPVIDYASALASGDGIGVYAEIMLKVTGICVVTRTACDICTDCGECAIANKLELVGKGMIALCVLPVLKNIIEGAKGFLM